MNYKIVLGVVFLSLGCLTAQNVLDHALISAQAQSMKEAQVKTQQMYETAAKVGAAALCGYIVYYGYTVYTHNNQAVTVNLPTELVQEFKQSPAVIKKAIEQYAAHENTYMNTTLGSFVKFTGSLVLQSMVFQALQPIFKNIQSYFSPKVSLPVTRSWFLAEQYQDSPEDMQSKKVEITQELFECIMQIESLEFAYKNHDADLIKDSAQVILSHIIFIKEYETRYLYQKHALQKVYDALVESIESMVSGARNTLFDEQKLETFKEHVRELRKLPAYSII